MVWCNYSLIIMYELKEKESQTEIENVSGNKVEEIEADPTNIEHGVYSVFANSSDMNLFITKNKNMLIKKLFIGTYGVIASDGDLSMELLELQQGLIKNLIDYLEESGIDSVQLIKFKTLDVFEPDTFDDKTFNDLLTLVRSKFDSILADNNGMFYSSDEYINYIFNDYLLLKNFDTFIENYLDGLIKVKPGYKNSFIPTLDGEPKYSSNIQLNPKQQWDDAKIESITDHTSKAVQLFLQTLTVENDVPLNPTNLSRLINWMAQFESYNFNRVRLEPQYLKVVFDDLNKRKSKIADPNIKSAFETIYDNIFDSDNSDSLYNLYKDVKNVKYNLYDMILNQISKTSALSYLQTTWDNDDKVFVTSELTSDYIADKKNMFDRSLIIHAKKVDLENLKKRWNINFVLDNSNEKLVSIAFNLGASRIRANLNTDDIVYTITKENDTHLLKGKELIREILQNPIGRKFLNSVFGRNLDNKYYSILTSLDPTDVDKVVDLAVGTLISSYINNTIDTEDLSLNNLKYKILSLINTHLDEGQSWKWFDKKTKAFKPSGIARSFVGVKAIAQTNSIITGDNAKSQVKDAAGNSLPKFGLTSAMNDDHFVKYQLEHNDFDETNPLRVNLFGGDKSEVLGKSFIDLEVVNAGGQSKAVAAMTAGELGFHRLVDCYLAHCNFPSQYMYFQPNTYADKSRIWVKRLNLNKPLGLQNFLGEELNKPLNELTTEQVAQVHQKTMGAAYEIYAKNIVNDYAKLFSIIENNDLTSYKKYRNLTFEQALKKFNSLNLSEIDIHTAVAKLQALGINIHIGPEIHYQPKAVTNKEGKEVLVAGNNTFRFFKEIFQNPELYKKKMTIEKALFAFKFQDEGIKLEVSNINGIINPTLERLSKNEKYKDWYNSETNEIIPFKVYNKDGKLIENVRLTIDNCYDPDNYNVVLNPVIERYFYLDNLATDNYNAILFGFSHAHKGQKKTEFNPNRIEWKDIRAYKEEESARTVAENKRGVIGGATIHPFLKNKLNGIPSKYKVAVVHDIADTTLNIQGGENEATPHDGAIFVDPFTGILETNSLPEIALSEIHRKPIAYISLQQYGISGLLKCATFVLNNEYLRLSSGKINGRRIMKKMSDIKWNDDRIDLTNLDTGFAYYFNPNNYQYYHVGFLEKQDDGQYRVVLNITDKDGNFMEKEEYIRSINSNYDLWETLGGEYSMKYTNDTLVFGETSVELVVEAMNSQNFINKNRIYLDGSGRVASNGKAVSIEEAEQTQVLYDQPLKAKQINYLANLSAVKNGAMNMNPASLLYNDITANPDDIANNFTYFEIGVEQLGIQMNAEHEVDKSHVSEMTQVISALEQLGHEHEIAQLVYEGIGEAINANQADLLGDIADPKIKSKMYKVLGRQLLRTFAENPDSDNYGLAQTFIEYIKEDLSSNKELKEQIVKIPFSDPSIAGKFLMNFTNGINKNIIKRQFAGIAAVQAPSHDLITIYDNNGTPAKLSDIRKRCKNAEEYEAALYDMDRYATLDRTTLDVGQVKVGDYVRVEYSDGSTEEGVVKSYAEDDMSFRKILDLRGRADVQIKILGSKGRNLRSQVMSFVIGNQTYTPFDLDSSRLAYQLREALDNTEEKEITKIVESLLQTNQELGEILMEKLAWSETENSEFSTAIENYKENPTNTTYEPVQAYINLMVQEDLENIQNRKLFHMPIKFRVGNEYVVIEGDLKYQANEMMLGKVWASKFLLKEGDNLSDITSSNFFLQKLATKFETNADPQYYDFYVTRNNGKHVHVSFNLDAVKDLDTIQVQTVLDSDGSLYRIENGKKTYKVETNWKFFTITDDNGESHEILYVPPKEAIKAVINLEQSNEFSTLIYNPSSKNIKHLVKITQKSKLVNNKAKTAISEAINKLSEDKDSNRIVVEELQKNLQESRTDAMEKLANTMYISFKQALNFITARIPAQSMQSFMNTTVVGFVDTKTNVAFVPVDILIYQGSDYDIDKAYILGAEIKNNGVYASWSDLFDFSSEKLFELSNNLSFPKKYIPESTTNYAVINGNTLYADALNTLILPYITSNDMQEKEVAFSYLVELINYLQKNKVNIEGLDPEIEELMTKHFNTNLNNKQKTDALKNMIYYNMWKTGKSLSNWIAQTTPISMGAARTAADASPSGQFAKHISNNNPMARFVSQYQNSIGKETIGIDAVGIKVWSLLLNYYHEGILHCKNPEEFLEKYTSYKRVYESGNIIRAVFEAKDDSGKAINLTQSDTNPNIDWNKVGTEEFKQELRADMKRFNNIPEDVFVTVSILLSSATDNAKELILEKINAGPDLSGVYIYLLSTGVKFDRIAEFMTTEIISLAQSKSKRNINLPQTQFNNMKSAIKYYLEGVSLCHYFSQYYIDRIDSKVYNYFRQNRICSKNLNDLILAFDNLEDLKNTLEPIRKYIIEESCAAPKYGQQYFYDYDDELFYDFDEYDKPRNYKVKGQRKLQINLNRFFEDVYGRQVELDAIKNKDNCRTNLNTLGMLLESAEELNILGCLGSLNQGIKPKLIDKITLEDRIDKFINGRINDNANAEEVKVLSEKWNLDTSNLFDFVLFTSNEEYQKDMVELYNKIKDTFNILDIIISVPHFKAMITAYGVDDKISENFVNTYQISKSLLKQFIKSKLIPQLTPKHVAKVNDFANEVIIHKFLNTLTDSGIYIHLGNKVYYNGQLIEKIELDLSRPDDRATFKYVFENNIIDKLKEKYPANSFIQDLTWNALTDAYGNQYQFLQLPLNLDTVDQESNRDQFNKYLQDFNSIKENTIDEVAIKDLFFLYNLIVNSNRPDKYSLTKIFKDCLKSGEIENGIIFKYSKFLGDLVENPITLDNIDPKDVIVRLLEPYQTYENLSKEYDSGLCKFVFKERGIAMSFNTLNNAVKLPMTTSIFNKLV